MTSTARKPVGVTDRARRRVLATGASERGADEARYRAIVETQDDAVCCWLPDTTLTFCNARYRELFGLNEAQGVGRKWLDFVPDAERDGVAAFYRDLAQQPHRVAYEHTATAADGSQRWIAWVDVPLFDASGRLREFQSVGRDITERRRAERALQRANRALRTRSECSHALMQMDDESALLHEICRRVVEFGGYRMAWIGELVDDAARSVRPLASAGADDGYLESIRVSWGDDEYGHGPTGTAIRECRPAVAHDIATDPRFASWREAARARGFGSSIALPLLLDEARCFGALNLYAVERDAFDGDEVAFLAELAADLGRGIRALRDRAARVQAEATMRSTAQRMKHVLSAGNVIVYSLRLQAGQFVARDVSENVERLLGYTVEEVLTGGWWFDHLHPEDRAAVAADLMRLMADGQMSRVYRFAHKDGRYLWIQDDQRVLKGADGQSLEVMGAWTDVSGRMRADQAVRDSEARLRLALEAAQQGIYDLDVRTGEAKISPEYATMLGYDPATFTETNAAWIERLHPDDREPVGVTYRDYIAGKIDSYRVEFRQRTADGSWKWILSIGKIVERAAGGAPLRMLGTHTDITERKLAEEALRESEQRYREMFVANPQPMWVYDLATLRFLAVNAAAIDKYGFSRDEFQAMTIANIRPAEDVPRLLANVAAVREGRDEAGIWRHRTKDGRELLVEITSHVMSFNGRRAEVVMANDVTGRLMAEAERRAATERFETLFRNAPGPMSISEFDGGRFIQVNDAFCAMFGYAAEEIVGRTAHELQFWTSAERRAQVIAELRAGRRVLAQAAQARTRSGQLRDTLISADRLDFGGTECLLLMLVDISERVQAQRKVESHERQLKELARRLLTKEEEERKALAQTLHDRFAQNLAAAKLGLEGALLGADRVEDAARFEMGKTLRRVVASLDDSITDVRGLLAELRPPLLAEFGLRAALRQEVETRRALAGGAEIVLRIESADRAARLAPAIEYGLFMIAREALANALLHAQAHRIGVELRADAAQAEIEIRDDGIGFDPSRMHTGHLGLTGMRERAALIDATLEIISEAGRGTVVTVVHGGGPSLKDSGR